MISDRYFHDSNKPYFNITNCLVKLGENYHKGNVNVVKVACLIIAFILVCVKMEIYIHNSRFIVGTWVTSWTTLVLPGNRNKTH